MRPDGPWPLSAAADRPVIAIVGGGFSGTLLASHLLRRSARPLELLLIDRNGGFGKGLAYGTGDPGHLLNVSAGAMSAWPSDPSHLLRWLELNRESLSDLLPADLDASSFIPRQVYGLYLSSILQDAIAHASPEIRFRSLTAEVVDLEPGAQAGAPYRLSLRDGDQLQADRVVLAWGNAAIPPEAPSDPLQRHGWLAGATADLDPDATVALLGTGLTMVDMVVSLLGQGHRGPVIALSRRGHAPNGHRRVRPIAPWLDPAEAPGTVLGLWRLIRRRVAQAEREGDDWRAVIDALRPVSQRLWAQLGERERRRFLRHAAVVWDVHRHRIAEPLQSQLQALLEAGQLRLWAARLERVAPQAGRLALQLRRRGHTTSETVHVDRLIRCTGIPLDYTRAQEPLLRQLRERGLLRSDGLGLGVRSAANGALLAAPVHGSPVHGRPADGSGQPLPVLYTIGSPRKGDLWETIAVPELRHQAQALAETLLRSLPRFLLPVEPVLPQVGAAESGAGSAVSAPAVAPPPPAFLWRQLFDPDTSTFTYLLADPASGEAALVDPVLEQLERDLQLLQELGLQLSFCLETHLHADHITAAGELRRRTGCRLIVPAAPGITNADQLLVGGERLRLQAIELEVIATPGHSPEHLSYLVQGSHLLTGDALLIRGCGRTDIQNGDPGQLYDSLQRLLALPEATLVFPAHDYLGRTSSSIGEEKRHNPKLAGRSREQFITLMTSQRLAPPRRIDQALPANLHLGDWLPGDHHDADLQAHLAGQAHDAREALAKADANRDIYNAYIGMYI